MENIDLNTIFKGRKEIQTKMNNIYKGTNNYLMKENPRTWPSKQFLETFEMYPQLEFVQYGNWSKLLELKTHPEFFLQFSRSDIILDKRTNKTYIRFI